MKLMKRMAFLAVIVVGGIVLLRSSYGSLAMKRIHGIYNERVSPETKLDLIKEELAKIGKDMRKNIGAVAEETVAVDNLREDVEVCQKNLDTQFERIVNMKKDVDAGEKVVMKNGRTVSVVQLQEKMSRAWESYKTSEDTLKSKRALLAAHEKALDAGRERLGAMKEKREQLEVQVAQLEAELKNVRLAQTRSDFNFDDSRIGDIQALAGRSSQLGQGRACEGRAGREVHGHPGRRGEEGRHGRRHEGDRSPDQGYGKEQRRCARQAQRLKSVADLPGGGRDPPVRGTQGATWCGLRELRTTHLRALLL